jgi:hypothetical protein
MGTLVEFYSIQPTLIPGLLQNEHIRTHGVFVGSISLNSSITAEALEIFARLQIPGADRLLTESPFRTMLDQVQMDAALQQLEFEANQNELAESLFFAMEDAAEEIRFRNGEMGIVIS